MMDLMAELKEKVSLLDKAVTSFGKRGRAAAQADADFSICRFVKHHGMFWFSIKNILPKWFQSPMLENKCVSSLSPSSMCSKVQ